MFSARVQMSSPLVMLTIKHHAHFRLGIFIASSGAAAPFRGKSAPPNSASSCLPSQVSSTCTSASETRRERSISNSTDQPASLPRFPLVADRREVRAALRSAAIVQPAVMRAPTGWRSGADGLLRRRRLGRWPHCHIRRLPAVMPIGLFRRRSGLFDDGDRRCLGVSVGQSSGE